MKFTDILSESDTRINDSREYNYTDEAVSGMYYLLELICDINAWENFAEDGTTFCVHDPNQGPVSREPMKGDLVEISIPAPGNPESNGNDWVEIKKLSLPNIAAPYFEMQLVPTAAPGMKNSHTAHFYASGACTRFVVHVEEKKVKVYIESLNLEPNIGEEAGSAQKIRNAAVAIAGKAGLSKIHWKALLNGWMKRL